MMFKNIDMDMDVFVAVDCGGCIVCWRSAVSSALCVGCGRLHDVREWRPAVAVAGREIIWRTMLG
jgi:hypothetical protein